jgi:tol-pal system protein YbgF
VAPISLPGNTPKEKYDFSTGLLQQGNYDMAEAALKTFVMQYPNDPLAGNAQYWLGEAHYVQGDFRSAAVAFAEGYQKYPQSQKAPDNLLKLAMSLGQQGQTQNACVALRQLDKKFPAAPANIKDRAQRASERYSCK